MRTPLIINLTKEGDTHIIGDNYDDDDNDDY